MDYVREKCRVIPTDTVDIIDENGWMAEIFLKEPLENIMSLFNARGTYILAVIELDEEQNVTKITPSLNEWEKKYQFLDRKLKHRDRKQAKMAAEATPPETPATPPVTGKEGKLNKKRSVNQSIKGENNKKENLTTPKEGSTKKSAGKRKKSKA